jgi:hypothetical protein
MLAQELAKALVLVLEFVWAHTLAQVLVKGSVLVLV